MTTERRNMIDVRLVDLIEEIKEDFDLPRVNSIYISSPHDVWNNKQVDYYSVCIDLENSLYEPGIIRHNFIVYVGNRMYNQEHPFNIWQVSEEIILEGLSKRDIYEIEDGYITTFQQEFNDVLAGCYMRFSVSIPLNTCD